MNSVSVVETVDENVFENIKQKQCLGGNPYFQKPILFACENDKTKAETNLFGVVIKDSNKLKLFRDIEGETCNYGNLRGLALLISDNEGFLWTRGYVPQLNTSTSLEIPNPLRIRIDKGDADIEQVLNDILCLTKLNTMRRAHVC